MDTADYTGGSCTGGEGTGEYTGDSGFGDARAFLKVNVTVVPSQLLLEQDQLEQDHHQPLVEGITRHWVLLIFVVLSHHSAERWCL